MAWKLFYLCQLSPLCSHINTKALPLSCTWVPSFTLGGKDCFKNVLLISHIEKYRFLHAGSAWHILAIYLFLFTGKKASLKTDVLNEHTLFFSLGHITVCSTGTFQEVSLWMLNKCILQYSELSLWSWVQTSMVQTYLPLSHQLPLCCWSSFDQSTSGSCDRLGCFQNLLFKVQALICLLFTWEGYQQSINTLCYRTVMICGRFIQTERPHGYCKKVNGLVFSIGRAAVKNKIETKEY